MKKGSTVYYLSGDHLGSTAITSDSSGTKVGELRYKPWGESRYTWGTTYTNRHFTGQLDETSSIGLYFFNARFYDPLQGRFTSADSIIPDPGNPQAWDRYTYGLNNPVKYIDPTGHRTCTEKQTSTGDETCDQNIVDTGGPILHRVFMGGFYASDPNKTKDQLPNSNPQPVTNPWLWLIEVIGLAGDFISPRNAGSNVFTYLNYSEYDNGYVGNYSISVINQSDQSIYMSHVEFSTERWDEGWASNLPSCAECRVFFARSTINSNLATVGPQSSTDINLNTYPSNSKVSINPDFGFPPFSGNVNVLVTAFLYANSVFGFWNFQTNAQISAPRP